jgi:hypothetical protein
MTTYFHHTSTLDDDCHFPVTATWEIHYEAKFAHDCRYCYVRILITKIELDEVRVYLLPDVGYEVKLQTIDQPLSTLEDALRKRLDMDQLYEEAFNDYQKHPDAGRDVA